MFRVSGSGFRVSGFGFRVQGSGEPLSDVRVCFMLVLLGLLRSVGMQFTGKLCCYWVKLSCDASSLQPLSPLPTH